ncbi:hypothetical protein B0H63DRAFT_405133 [Podospora didyma]|uniref:Uncharacterized protein n=1 Tax=Podospora didyma TaxID=330526 RepID=A0AAE0K0J9_9PEZI|nr:hypothetical protein B0H63DRAFT_405133 [Podospora didyma]
MSSPAKSRHFLLDTYRSKHSWAAGVTRGSPSAVEWHKKDLEKAFAEIDGLMAGLQYQDKADSIRDAQKQQPSSMGASVTENEQQYPTYPPDLDFIDIVVQDGPVTAPVPPPPKEHQPMASQWDTIRTLRDETVHHHRKFQQYAKNSQDPVITALLKVYPEARKIRNAGAQVFRDVLDGFRPRQLKHVFAFASFAYAMSQLLYRKNRIDKSEILADLRQWRDLISDPTEREAFNNLARELWPEANDRLHFIHIPPSVRTAPFPDVSHWPPATNRDGMINEDTDISALDLAYFFSNPPAVLNTTNLLQQHGLGPPGNQPPASNVIVQEDAIIDTAPSRDEQEPAGSVHDEPDKASLENTGMFTVVFTFLREIGELLYILSGTSLASRRYKLYKAEEGDRESFYDSAQEKFFNPRRRSSEHGHPESRALLSVAETFTKRGYLRSISQIEHYLVGVAAAVLPPGDLFRQFITCIMQDGCVMSASAGLDSNSKLPQQADGNITSSDVATPPRPVK